jgi:hypothetical protein
MVCSNYDRTKPLTSAESRWGGFFSVEGGRRAMGSGGKALAGAVWFHPGRYRVGRENIEGLKKGIKGLEIPDIRNLLIIERNKKMS